MNARSYWEQAQDEIFYDKARGSRDVIKHVRRLNTVLSIKVKKDKMDAMPNWLLV